MKTELSEQAIAQRKKSRRINSTIMVVMIILSVLMIGLFAFNMINIGVKEEGGSGETLALDASSKESNDQYTIGNNPTDYQKEIFDDLTSALKGDDEVEIAAQVVKNFIADFYTWTNKDGNYEVGGLMYIYGPKYTVFQEEMRYTFYSDLDLYISQYGRENLLEVTNVDITSQNYAADYTVDGETFKAYYIEAEWDYAPSSKIDVDSFQNVGYYTVIDNDGRYEIVSMYDHWD